MHMQPYGLGPYGGYQQSSAYPNVLGNLPTTYMRKPIDEFYSTTIV